MSGITQYEDFMVYPNAVLSQDLGFSNAVMSSYQTQLYLRKQLNTLHGLLYKKSDKGPQGPHLPGKEAHAWFKDAVGFEASQAWNPGLYYFTPTHPPASDILTARIRAKVWGAHVIMYRPHIKTILDFNHNRLSNEQTASAPGGFLSHYIPPPDGHTTAAEILEGARKGIYAHFQSTKAFHGLKEKRFIITNVFGTAHA